MSLIQKELDRIGETIRQPHPVPRYDELYAAQQALMWALDPETYKAPYDLLAATIGIPEDSEGCPAGNDHSASLGTLDHRAS
jgi:hypothetical protein